MKIQRIHEQESAGLDLEENTFTSNEVFDIRLIDGQLQLDKRVVESFTKTYDGDAAVEDDVELFGAFVDGTLAGKIELASSWNELASIEHIVVGRRFRRLGIATGLLDFAKRWVLGKRLKGIRLETQTNNVPACKLYFRNGFEVGGFDRFIYRTQPGVADEIALYLYWFPAPESASST